MRSRLLFPILLVAACGSVTEAPEPGPPAAVRILSGNYQTAEPGTTLPTRFAVVVTDTADVPVPLVTLTWVIVEGAGRLDPARGETDLSGRASTVLSLTSRTGLHIVDARLADDEIVRATFTIFVQAQGDTTGGPDARVEIRSTTFDPAVLYVGVGQTVEWRWPGDELHNVTFDDPTIGPRSAIGNGINRSSGTWSHTFDRSGTFPYRCTQHPQTQRGTINVN